MATLQVACAQCNMCGGGDTSKVLVNGTMETEVLAIAHHRYSIDAVNDVFRAAKLTCGSTPFDVTFSIRCIEVDDASSAAQRCVIYTRQLLKAYRYFIIDEFSANVLRLQYEDGKVKVEPFGVALYIANFDASYGNYYAKGFEQMLTVANAKPMRKSILV